MIDREGAAVVESLSNIADKIDADKKHPKGILKKNNKIDVARIASIAEKINNGSIKLPKMDYESDEQWDAVWALWTAAAASM